MKVILEFNNLSGEKIACHFFLKIFSKILETKELKKIGGKKFSLSLALVSSEEIKKLNCAYRRKNSPTDVLSFSEFKNQEELLRAGDKNIFLGEITLCYNQIKEYARKDRQKPEDYLAEAAAHGLLHLLGFRHGKKMFAIQEKATK